MARTPKHHRNHRRMSRAYQKSIEYKEKKEKEKKKPTAERRSKHYYG